MKKAHLLIVLITFPLVGSIDDLEKAIKTNNKEEALNVLQFTKLSDIEKEKMLILAQDRLERLKDCLTRFSLRTTYDYDCVKIDAKLPYPEKLTNILLITGFVALFAPMFLVANRNDVIAGIALTTWFSSFLFIVSGAYMSDQNRKTFIAALEKAYDDALEIKLTIFQN